jgi:hypothetical protein
MFCVRSYELTIVSAISLMANLRSPIIRSHTFAIFSSVLDVVGRPERDSSSMLFRPRLNSATHFFYSLNVVSMCSWTSFGANLFLNKYWINTRSSLFSIFWKRCTWCHLNQSNLKTVESTATKNYTVITEEYVNLMRVV